MISKEELKKYERKVLKERRILKERTGGYVRKN